MDTIYKKTFVHNLKSIPIILLGEIMPVDAIVSSKMYEIDRIKDVIDRMSARLNNGVTVFRGISLEKPKLSPAELGLLRAVSWFYVLYFEAGAVNVQFLSQRLKVYNLDPTGKLSNHLDLINRLRTYFHHNLDPSKPRERNIQGYCEDWFKTQCGTSEPNCEDEWYMCLSAFLQEILDFFTALEKSIRKIEQDESKKEILSDWEVRRTREHPSQDYDPIIYKTANDMGRNNLDVVGFRQRFYEKWKKELTSLGGNYIFEIEARKLIEYTLLNETLAVLPITGEDILFRFPQIQPGPIVGELLRHSKIIYEKEPCSKEELLMQLDLFLNHL